MSPSKGSSDVPVKVRRLRLKDIEAVLEVQRAAYGGMSATGLCDRRHFELQRRAFSEGQLVATVDGAIVGYAASLIIALDEDSPWYSYAEITGNGTFSTHEPSGDTLYGADIAVHPDHRGKGVARALYAGRIRLLRRQNLRQMVAGGRIPGYREHAGRMTAEEYVAAVQEGTLRDPSLSAHLAVGYTVKGVHLGYLRDAESLNYATYLELPNASFRSELRRIAAAPLRRPSRRLRVCAAQWGMRPITGWDELEHQVQFFVRTAEQYHCHLLVLPELFTAQLFSAQPPGLHPRVAIERLADDTQHYRDLFQRWAQAARMFIVAGSHPTRRGGAIYNTAHLFSPSGAIHTQDKLHITPNERETYGITPGEALRVFDIGYARLALPVCYDIEFPELCRILTQAGAEVFCCPFSTDERKAYLRVRYSAHARAVENQVYVALSGNVGNLPQVDNFLVNYGQAALLTPSDFAFPPEGVAAVSDSNSETVVIGDFDLDALHQAREIGSVRPLRDRRLDLYELTARVPVEKVRVE